MIGGSTRGVTAAVEALRGAGFAPSRSTSATPFTTIVEPASGRSQTFAPSPHQTARGSRLWLTSMGSSTPSGEGVEPASSIFSANKSQRLCSSSGAEHALRSRNRLFIRTGPEEGAPALCRGRVRLETMSSRSSRITRRSGEVPALQSGCSRAPRCGVWGHRKQATQNVAPSSIRSAETAVSKPVECRDAKPTTTRARGPVAWEERPYHQTLLRRSRAFIIRAATATSGLGCS